MRRTLIDVWRRNLQAAIAAGDDPPPVMLEADLMADTMARYAPTAAEPATRPAGRRARTLRP